MKFAIIAVIMLSFLGFQGYLFGTDDLYSLIFIIITSVILYFTIHDLHVSTRQIWRINTEDGSWLHKFLTGGSFITRLTASIVSLIASIILVTILKGMMINYGFLGAFSIILMSCLAIFTTSEIFSAGQNLVKDNLKEELYSYANKFIILISLVLIFNLVISLSITFVDISDFINSKINLNDFEKYTEAKAIVSNGNNFYTKAIINLHLLVDSLKIAVSNYIFSSFNIDKTEHYWVLFFGALFLNFIKMFGFSFAFIYLQITITESVDKIINKIQTINIKRKEEKNEIK